MFGRGADQRLHEVIEEAEAALASADLAKVVAAADALDRAVRDASDSDLLFVALELLEDLRAARVKLQPAREIEVRPCRGCDGEEFLRSRHPVSMKALPAGFSSIDLEVDVLICRACGDVRLVADPKKAVDAALNLAEPAFERAVIKRPPGGPLR